MPGASPAPKEPPFPTLQEQPGLLRDRSVWDGAPGLDRRRHPRAAFAAPVAVHELDSHGCPQHAWPCRAVDLSPSGIGLQARRMIHAGRAIFVTLPLPGGRKKVVYGQVRYSRYESSGIYRVGVEFDQPPQTDDIRKWLAAQ